ncbi:hypothetical protein D9M70_584420 [compost metagenome]
MAVAWFPVPGRRSRGRPKGLLTLQTSAFSGVQPAGGAVGYINVYRSQLNEWLRPSWLRPVHPTRWSGPDGDIGLIRFTAPHLATDLVLVVA